MILISDGALIIGQLDHQLLESFEQFNIPFIILNDRIDNYSWVSVDDYYSMSLALNHLYELGHRRIAYRCAPQQHQLLLKHSSINDRHNAYRDWIKERNLPYFSDFGQNMDEDKFYNEMLKHKITAVVTYGYLLAIALNEHCRKCNANVPDDISIVAFNRLNEKFKGYNFTSIYMELEDMGNAAVDILLKKIDGSLLNEQRVFKTYLHEGESSGPCCRKTLN